MNSNNKPPVIILLHFYIIKQVKRLLNFAVNFISQQNNCVQQLFLNNNVKGNKE